MRAARGGFEQKGGDVTLVVQVAEGVRIRLPFTANPFINWPKLNEDEDELCAALRNSPLAPVIATALGEKQW